MRPWLALTKTEFSGIALQKTVLNKMLDYEPVYTPQEETAEGWDWEIRGEKEDLTWLIK